AVRAAVAAAFAAARPAVGSQSPPRIELGDLALTAPFDLARALRRSPREIAERLAAGLAGAPGVRKAGVAGGGYVNLFLDRSAAARVLCEGLVSPRPAPPVPGRTVVEPTSINPNKAAH